MSRGRQLREGFFMGPILQEEIELVLDSQNSLHQLRASRHRSP